MEMSMIAVLMAYVYITIIWILNCFFSRGPTCECGEKEPFFIIVLTTHPHREHDIERLLHYFHPDTCFKIIYSRHEIDSPYTDKVIEIVKREVDIDLERGIRHPVLIVEASEEQVRHYLQALPGICGVESLKIMANLFF
jgi:hypothetical protein